MANRYYKLVAEQKIIIEEQQNLKNEQNELNNKLK